MQMLRRRLYFRRFRAGTATSLGFTTALATMVTGGVLQRAVRTLHGPASWTTALAMQAVTTAIREVGCLLGASGINEIINDEL